MPTTDARTLSTCSHCGGRDVDMICVPGGWMQVVCRNCSSDWWIENSTIRLADPAVAISVR